MLLTKTSKPAEPAAPRSPSPATEMLELSRPECLKLLAANTVGRLAVTTQDRAPVIRPVNYVFDTRSQSVVFRTGLGSKLHHLLQASKAAFEIDGTEQRSRTGWSVIIAGVTEHVTNPTELHHLESLSVDPWAPGHKGHLVRIRAYSVSGRRIALVSDALPGYRA
jgi:nitroimidazol reductase NimA-like FMN-containing flavoprotein (pyridoxamine 5'-phosphate oxidase superfamily)